jgi:hypothetical protein
VSRADVTLTAPGFFTLLTTLSLHANGVAYLRPIDSDMSAAAVGPFVFWNAGRSVGWPATTTTLTFVTESTISGDAGAMASIDATIARLNDLALANVNGERVRFARATAAACASCAMRVDAKDPDIVASNVAGWTRYLLSGGVITACTIVFRSIADAQTVVVRHEMIHGLGLGHTSTSVSGVTLMDGGFINSGLLGTLDRVVATNIAMAFSRRPNTLLTGSMEDERAASSLSSKRQEIGLH